MSAETVHPLSISVGKDLKVPAVDFKYAVTLDVSLSASRNLSKTILANFGRDENVDFALKPISLAFSLRQGLYWTANVREIAEACTKKGEK